MNEIGLHDRLSFVVALAAAICSRFALTCREPLPLYIALARALDWRPPEE